MVEKCNQKEQKNSILTIAYSRQIQTRNLRTGSALKPSISSHSKPGTMAHTRLLKCFNLQHSVYKTKHLRSIVRGVVRGFE